MYSYSVKPLTLKIRLVTHASHAAEPVPDTGMVKAFLVWMEVGGVLEPSKIATGLRLGSHKSYTHLPYVTQQLFSFLYYPDEGWVQVTHLRYSHGLVHSGMGVTGTRAAHQAG